MKESKDRYCGKFIWGINLLRENLDYHKIKELKLQMEKKLLLISISHDIQTPLNTIKLYAKAIAEEVYHTNEKKILAAKQGNGLGLYICKCIMKKMDGEIFAECEREGMSFTLAFR